MSKKNSIFTRIRASDGVKENLKRGNKKQNERERERKTYFFCPGVNTGISVQIAIIRGENWTTLHVNEYNVTVNATPILLDTYSNKPWINPEKEVLAPQRPPAPPTDYFQVCFCNRH